MSAATDELARVFWENPQLRQTAQLAIAEIDVLAAQRDACLAACRTALEMCRKDNCGRRVVQPALLAAIALCEPEQPETPTERTR